MAEVPRLSAGITDPLVLLPWRVAARHMRTGSANRKHFAKVAYEDAPIEPAALVRNFELRRLFLSRKILEARDPDDDESSPRIVCAWTCAAKFGFTTNGDA